MDDHQLVDLFWRRDEDAIKRTEAAYGQSLLWLAQRITGDADDAQECVNDTWLAVWNAIPPGKTTIPLCLSFQNMPKFRFWGFGQTRR